MSRIKLKIGDILFLVLDGNLVAKAEVLFVEQGTLMQVSLHNEKTEKVDDLQSFPNILRCADIYLEPGMGWTMHGSAEVIHSKSSFCGINVAASLSKIAYECKVACGVLQKEGFSLGKFLRRKLWPFREGVFCNVLHDESCLWIGKKKIKYDSLEWKGLLSENKVIHFEEPEHEVYLGCIKKACKGFMYDFVQGAIRKTVYIEGGYITWPIIYHFWNYYGDLNRPEVFHQTIPPWFHTA